LSQCQQIVANNSYVTADRIFGFAYDGKDDTLHDISLPLRRYIAGDMSAKDALYPWPHQFTSTGITEKVYGQ